MIASDIWTLLENLVCESSIRFGCDVQPPLRAEIESLSLARILIQRMTHLAYCS